MPPSIATPLSSGTTGHAEDPPGLTWGRARCYAPRTGGWTGEDPVFTEPRYAYVGGRPSYGVDPTGRLSATTYTKLLFLGCAVSVGKELIGHLPTHY